MSPPATESTSTGDQISPPSIATVKLPEFWTTDSELWFITIESIFRKNRITTQLSKYDYVVAALPQSIASIVRDVLRAPPADNPYEKLKMELTRRTTESEQRRIQQLLTTEELGDRKPSDLLRRMHQLLGDRAESLDASIFKELFLQRLPQQVRMILSTLSEPLETLAQMADKIMDVSALGISAVSQKPPAAGQSSGAHSLEEKFSQLLQSNKRLSEQVDQLAKNLRDLRARPSRPSSPHTSRGRRPSATRDDTNRWCWYHRLFGDDARKCTQPCAFPENTSPTH